MKVILQCFFCNQTTYTYLTLKPYMDNKIGLAFLCKLYNSGFIEFDNELLHE